MQAVERDREKLCRYSKVRNRQPYAYIYTFFEELSEMFEKICKNMEKNGKTWKKKKHFVDILETISIQFQYWRSYANSHFYVCSTMLLGMSLFMKYDGHRISHTSPLFFKEHFTNITKRCTV